MVIKTFGERLFRQDAETGGQDVDVAALLTNLYLDRQTMIDFVSPAIEIALERLGATAGVGRAREHNAATGRARRFPIAFPKLPAVTRFFLA